MKLCWIYVAIFSILYAANFVESRTGVCYRQQSRRVQVGTTYRATAQHSYRRCGWTGRCIANTWYIRESSPAYSTQYHSVFGCCSGYRQVSSTCQPVCSSSCRNGGTCTAPNRCTCPAGWTGTYCQTDVNECRSTSSNPCAHKELCVNTRGSYTCSCRTGYRLGTDRRSCSNINECAENQHECEYKCARDTPGSYVCSCRLGYKLASDGRGCTNRSVAANQQLQICSTPYPVSRSMREKVDYYIGCGLFNWKRCTRHYYRNKQWSETAFNYSCCSGYRESNNRCEDKNECTRSSDNRCSHYCHNNVGSYTCSCRNGYRLHSNGYTCQDINECSISNICPQRCVNTQGSYYCSCNSGYTRNSDGRTCSPVCSSSCLNGGTCTAPNTCSCRPGWSGSRCQTDVNECASSRTHQCAQNCHNNRGSYSCSCRAGYRISSNGRSCLDVNECSGNHGCQHSCRNTAGSYYCSCNSGYSLNSDRRTCRPVCSRGCYNGGTCIAPNRCSCTSGWTGSDCRTDVNECARSVCSQNCQNTRGSYRCSCNHGYRLMANNRDCQDMNECAEGLDHCDQGCRNTQGSYTCICTSGYVLDTDGCSCNPVCGNGCANGGTCIAPNRCNCASGWTGSDCRTDVNECASSLRNNCSQLCANTAGSYTCSCRQGYQLDFDGRTCRDVNECDEGLDHCQQRCTNLVGSYSCSCDTGYTLQSNNLACSDVNECASPWGNGCSQVCDNIPGSHRCSCFSGYQLASDNRTCQDVDECGEGLAPCEQNCTNIDGSYQCSCNQGYTLGSDRSTCNDLDECSEGTAFCHHNCTNSEGSFNCSCMSGYRLKFDNRSCDDIDECYEDSNLCDQVCSNTVGSYDCYCNDGYFLANDSHSCVDIDECLSKETNKCDQNCVNTVGSYTCRCKSGYMLVDNSCQDIDECSEGVDNCDQECRNIDGSFICSCKEGYILMEDKSSCTEEEVSA